MSKGVTAPSTPVCRWRLFSGIRAAAGREREGEASSAADGAEVMIAAVTALVLEGGSTSARDVYSAQTGEALKITEAAGDGHGGAWNRGTGGRAGPQGTLVTPTRIQCVLVLRPFGPREREREREREARVSGHLKSTDCSDVSKASAPDKEAAPEGPNWLLLREVCVCVGRGAFHDGVRSIQGVARFHCNCHQYLLPVFV